MLGGRPVGQMSRQCRIVSSSDRRKLLTLRHRLPQQYFISLRSNGMTYQSEGMKEVSK